MAGASLTTTGKDVGERPTAGAPPFATKENLFSEHFLRNVLPKHADWQEVKDLAQKVQGKVRELLQRQAAFEAMTELSLDREFFEPIFRELGHVSFVQVRTEAGKFPDYFFFENEATKKEAESEFTDRRAFAQKAIAIGELKAWDRPLDGTATKRDRDELDVSIPSAQLYRYLLANEKWWGVLTNGRKWRIYHYDGGFPKIGRYYEVDLVSLAQGGTEEFSYFVYFFRRQAFVPDSNGKTTLDKVRQGSVEFSKALAQSLEDAVYKALRVLANGFLSRGENGLDGKNPDHRRLVHEGSLKLLYRLLFILKAESAGLLPLDNPHYRAQRSLDAIKRDVAAKKASGTIILNDSDEYARKLNLLCNLIDTGSRAAGLGKPGQPDPLGIPPYNGGLFRQVDPDSKAKDFLAVKQIGDAYMAEAIDLLARGAGATPGEGFVDYTSLEAQQLGTLYEGLLGYQLGYAESEDYLAVGDGEQWIPESKHSGPAVADPERRGPAGTFFLQTDKGERHSTGSYYTPDFIVQEIVQKTIAPVLDRRLEAARMAGKSLRDALLRFRVLDPAMGSGHFLVGVVDYLTPKLIEAIDEDKRNGRIPKDMDYSTEDARRDIVGHCVYGVDLNPMAVELAKVTLWLHTLARGKPLTFLDHRLKVGNTLLGADPRRLSRYPTAPQQEKWAEQVAAARKERSEKRFEEAGFPTLFLEKITGRIAKIDALRDDKIEEVKQKEAIYRELRYSPEFQKIGAICDIWTAAWFGTWAAPDGPKEASSNYADLMWALSGRMSEDEWARKSRRANLETIQRLAKRKRFFHWEFEFPEVFFPEGQLRDDVGFDVVLGNPPYLNIETLYSSDPEAPPVFEKIYETAGEGRYDIYVIFVERGLEQLCPDGEFGYIMPNKWFKGEFGRPLRSLVTRRQAVREIVDWRNYYTLFPGAITYVALVFLTRRKSKAVRYVAFPNLLPSAGPDDARACLQSASRTEAANSRELIVADLPSGQLGQDQWNFASGAERLLLERLRALPRLGTLVNIFAGAQTSALPIYMLEEAAFDESSGTVRGWSAALEREVTVEKDVVRPLLRGKDLARYRLLADDAVIIWPYETVADGKDGQAVLINSESMARRFPLAWDYLNEPQVRATLEAREPEKVVDPKTGKVTKVGRFEGKPDWYAFAYPRAMGKFSTPKLVFPDAASEGTVAYDDEGRALVHTVYAIETLPKTKHSLFFFQPILNNHVLRFFMEGNSNPLKDGFYRFQTRFMGPYPVPTVAWVTPRTKRDQAREEAARLLVAAESNKGDGPILAWVEARLSDGASDVVHDLLADLAQRLNALYFENSAETKAFLGWFRRTFVLPDARLDAFSGKTKLQRLSEFPVAEILEVLRKNSKHLSKKPNDRSFQEEFVREFNASVAKQRPRFEVARRLEQIAEEIVYRMYALSIDERAIVEEAGNAIQYR